MTDVLTPPPSRPPSPRSEPALDRELRGADDAAPYAPSSRIGVAGAVIALLAVWGLASLALGWAGLLVPLLVATVFLGMRLEPAWLVSIGLAMTVFSGWWDQLGFPIGLDRVLFAGAAVALLLRLPVDRAPKRRLVMRPVHVALAAIAIYGTVSALLVGTISETKGLFALFDKLGLVPFALFVLAPLVFPDRRQRRILLGVLTVVGLYLGITAFLEGIGLKSATWPSYINDPTLGSHFDRARGPFLEAAGNGLALFQCAVAAAVGVTEWRRWWAKAAGALVSALCIFGTLFTLTRSVWIGAVVGVVAAMISSPRLRRYLVPLALVGLVALLAAFAFVPNLSKTADERANDDYSVWDRKNLAVAATNVIKDKPLFGLGWSTFTSKADLYFDQQGTYPLTAAGFDVHNLALGMYAELGLIGGTLWLAALVLGVLVPVFRRGPPRLAWWKVGFVAIVAQWLVVVNLTPGGFAFSMYFVWLWAGIVSTDHTSTPLRYVRRTWIPRRVAPVEATAAAPAIG